MILAASMEEARTRHKDYSLPNGTEVKIDTYLGTNIVIRGTDDPEPRIGDPTPMAYLVGQRAGTVIAPHFHQNDQFQVFISGAGRMGSIPLRAVTVHFAAAFSPYGPIVAEGSDIEYVTLRNGYDPGAQWMPGEKTKLKAAKRGFREATSAPTPAGGGDATLIEPHADGLAAWCHELGGGESRIGANPSGGGGQFWLVLRGQVSIGRAIHGERACVFASPDEAPLQVQAGPIGTQLVVVQFPKR